MSSNNIGSPNAPQKDENQTQTQTKHNTLPTNNDSDTDNTSTSVETTQERDSSAILQHPPSKITASDPIQDQQALAHNAHICSPDLQLEQRDSPAQVSQLLASIQSQVTALTSTLLSQQNAHDLALRDLHYVIIQQKSKLDSLEVKTSAFNEELADIGKRTVQIETGLANNSGEVGILKQRVDALRDLYMSGSGGDDRQNTVTETPTCQYQSSNSLSLAMNTPISRMSMGVGMNTDNNGQEIWPSSLLSPLILPVNNLTPLNPSIQSPPLMLRRSNATNNQNTDTNDFNASFLTQSRSNNNLNTMNRNNSQAQNQYQNPSPKQHKALSLQSKDTQDSVSGNTDKQPHKKRAFVKDGDESQFIQNENSNPNFLPQQRQNPLLQHNQALLYASQQQLYYVNQKYNQQQSDLQHLHQQHQFNNAQNHHRQLKEQDLQSERSDELAYNNTKAAARNALNAGNVKYNYEEGDEAYMDKINAPNFFDADYVKSSVAQDPTSRVSGGYIPLRIIENTNIVVCKLERSRLKKFGLGER